jgi:hypothetical protein
VLYESPGGKAEGLAVEGFLLVDPSVPTIAAGEIAALENALALVEAGITSSPDQPVGLQRAARLIRDSVQFNYL